MRNTMIKSLKLSLLLIHDLIIQVTSFRKGIGYGLLTKAKLQALL